MEQGLSKQETFLKGLDVTVMSVLSANDIQGFERAYKVATAAGELKRALTSEYMKPFMELQNNRLGFKTDKQGGYDESTVKNCLIEAVLTGVEPTGNQFNIIAGNCYITKEGFGHLLAHYPGLSYEIIPQLPRISANSAAIVMRIEWTINGGVKQSRDIDFPIKVNQYMGTDAVIGKATRKARAWLFNTITGFEIGDGDVTEANVVESKITDKEAERIEIMINDAKTVDELNKIKPHLKDAQFDLFNNKMIQIQTKK